MPTYPDMEIAYNSQTGLTVTTSVTTDAEAKHVVKLMADLEQQRP